MGVPIHQFHTGHCRFEIQTPLFNLPLAGGIYASEVLFSTASKAVGRHRKESVRGKALTAD
jgi:hypothetical protein